ncbi:ABC-F type ribosomal protection protein [Cytobacillus spongiae]|uniref:ribosomal protection-like ABC-F family protein n=1 Tax=Cytobacillus spongiae TaxID=2901381 RepID=UPI001F189AD1|nr:ABC-F type ribosomal protection protein [Cytobacillus spongiae]UII56483.1 ABC-F type ribosomal protection protein [Cytobacillus spongiae]
MIACSVNEIGKMYGGNTIFENISLEISENDRIGFVGRNGGGKTTLFKMLAGEETPDSGKIHWKKGLMIGYLAQLPEFPYEMETRSVLRTAFASLIEMQSQMKRMEEQMVTEQNEEKLGRLVEQYGKIQERFIHGNGYEIEAQIDRVTNGLKIEALLNKPYSNLSGGERTKVGLALLLLKKPDFLLLDEPTNHLDLIAVEWLSQFLKEYEGTVAVISHDRYFLDEVVTKIMDLEDGEIQLYHTNYSNFVKEKEERLLKEFQAYEEQQKKIKKMKEAIKRLREWANNANPPNEGLHKRARNMERALERMEKLSRPVLNRKKMNLDLQSADRSGKDVVMLKGIDKSYQDRKLLEDVHIHIQFQEKVAIVGENGTGKSTLLKMILRECTVDTGEVRIGSQVKIGYLSQHVYGEHEEETVLEAFRNVVHVTEGEARHLLARFLFYGHAVFRKVNHLSGGERMRLRLAQLMHQDINFLLLDEPTNHLDIDSREVLEEALAEFSGTILAVSHDRYFLNKLFEKIYWIERGKVQVFDGNYDWAKAKRGEIHRKEPAPLKAVKELKPSPIKEKKPSHSFEKYEVLLESIEQKIYEMDEALKNEMELDTLQKIYSEKQRLEDERAELYQELEKFEA